MGVLLWWVPGPDQMDPDGTRGSSDIAKMTWVNDKLLMQTGGVGPDLPALRCKMAVEEGVDLAALEHMVGTRFGSTTTTTTCDWVCLHQNLEEDVAGTRKLPRSCHHGINYMQIGTS